VKYPKLRELGEAIRAAFLGPYTSRFPKEAHVPHPNFRGQPVFDAEKCLGCLACEEICPVNAIAHEDDLESNPPVRRMIHYTDTCIYCGMCEIACINDHLGIVLGSDWELSYFDRKKAFETIEKELQLCEACGDAIATKDHLVWLAERLGEMAYSNPTVYMARLEALGVADPNLVPVLRDRGRSDRVKILCARCRRETTQYPDEGE
jgi:hydrogenase-4 component H